MNRKDIMVDIETLGTSEGSSVFQIVATSFNISTGETYSTYHSIGDIKKFAKLNVDGSTLKWWLEEDKKDLLSELISKGTSTEEEMYIGLYEWLLEQSETGDMKDVYLWGNGILFDNAKLQREMNRIEGINYPIFFRNDRDVRTILELASLKSGISENEIKDSVTNTFERKHDAYDDVQFQIRMVSAAYDMLMNEIVTESPKEVEPLMKVKILEGADLEDLTVTLNVGDEVEIDKVDYDISEEGRTYLVKDIYFKDIGGQFFLYEFEVEIVEDYR